MSRPAAAIEAPRSGESAARGLRFEKDLESRFVAACKPERMRHFLVSGWPSLLFFNAFVLSDWFMVHDVFALALILRVAVTAVGALTLWHIHHHQDRWLTYPYAWLEMAMVGQCMVCSFALAPILAFTHSAMGPFYHAGYVLALVVGIVIYRLRFAYCCLIFVFALAMHFVSRIANPQYPSELFWAITSLIVAIGIYLLTASWRMESEERQRFLLRMHEQDLLDELTRTNAQLEALSLSDGLTAVANRRHLDRFLSEQWEVLRREDRPFSLLMIDVDHFKAYNDRYGHPAGDECLRCVAGELRRLTGAWSANGLVARWGGEEFVVALPGQDAGQARTLASHLRLGILALGLRHDASPTANSVTISVGVATVMPRTFLSLGLHGLIEEADTALYRAKTHGRNSVRVAGESTTRPAGL